MDLLLQLDYEIFKVVNGSLENPIFNVILPIVRNKYIWIPFYVFILSYAFYNFIWQRATVILFALVTVIAVSDVFSGQIFKKSIERLRPCSELVMKDVVVQRVRCSNSFSMPSAHASNHFALAYMIVFLFQIKGKRWKWTLYGWALIIAVAQVYVGLHYPSDILAGAAFGLLVAFTYQKIIYTSYQVLLNPRTDNPPT